MKAYRKIKLSGLFHGFKQKFLVHNRDSIIRESCRTSRCKIIHVHKFLACELFCHCGSLNNVNTSLGAFLLYILQSIQIIHCRLCIRHTYNHGKSAPGCSRSSCIYIFFICESRITKMHMCIHKSRRDHKSRGINHLSTIHIQVLSGLCYSISVNQHIHNPICACYRVNNSSVFYQYHSLFTSSQYLI